jgi:ParB family chromosome partitioning protein
MENSAAPEQSDRYELIPLGLIDEPLCPERETMEEHDLADLAFSIQDVGLIQPLSVIRQSGRFEVTAGHRRLLACRMVNLDPVPCIIKATSAIDPLAVMVAENAYREAVNPIEEARFFERILEGICGNDVDVLCEKVRRSRNYVEDRLLLLRGYPGVVDALQQKQISLAVAKELNKVKQPNRLIVFLDAAIRQGATARTVAEWRKESNADEDLQITQVNSEGAAVDGAAAAQPWQQLCFFCEDGADPHLMVTVHMHRPCLKMVEKVLGRDPQSNAAGVN